MRRIRIFIWCIIIFSPFYLFSNKDDSYVFKGFNAGMFANLASVIGLLHDYEDNVFGGFYVDFEENQFYTDLSIGTNWWEYYFQPISVGKQGLHVMPSQLFVPCAYFAIQQLPVKKANELLNKYIIIKQFILEEVEAFIKENDFDNYYMIGVHYRGTDKTKNSREANPVSYQELYKLMLVEKSKHKNVKFFIASDDQRFVDYLNEVCPKDFCQYDQLRSTTDAALHTNKHIPPYEKGKSALVDCLLLSKSNTLVRMSSNLSTFSIMFNPDMIVINANQAVGEYYLRE